jgi:hypothetical protein
MKQKDSTEAHKGHEDGQFIVVLSESSLCGLCDLLLIFLCSLCSFAAIPAPGSFQHALGDCTWF